MALGKSGWKNLIRFEDQNGTVYYGDAFTVDVKKLVGAKVSVLRGAFEDLQHSGEDRTVAKLLAPVPSPPYVICVGLNYADHAKEANLPVPPTPVTFSKPAASITGPEFDVLVPPHAKLLDYEGELCIVISRTGKNISEKDAPGYIAGFTVGNDVSSRHWQRPPYSGGQFCYAKSFDTFAPIGPTLLNPAYAFDSKGGLSLEIRTRVNGETRQHSSTTCMLFTASQIIAHVSRGTTLAAGTVIMTGTPAGIAAKMKGEPWLKDGDVVEVEIDGIGRLRNRIVFEQDISAEEKNHL